ncbi:hypothetical protein HDU76_013399 [Blyttiomyces sp. JEL0837]|nr:hypothetical protein HDU76_013399 [Blyttiomyces sp. JEL0837]
MAAVMNCQPDAAVLFIENVHALLTNRKMPLAPQESTFQLDETPHFALPTTSIIIRTTAASPQKAAVIATEHKAFIRKSREPRHKHIEAISTDAPSVQPKMINRIQVKQTNIHV